MSDIVNYEQYTLSLGEILLHEEMNHTGDLNCTSPLGIFRYLIC